jgi:hypothetical protein
MARLTRKKLKFDESSVNDLLQEIYNDTHNIRSLIKRLFTKWENKVKEGGEIAALGDQIVKLIAAEAKNQDQKIMLLKYLKEVVFQKNNPTSNKESDDDNSDLSTERKNELIKMVHQQLKEKDKKN